MGYKLKRIMMRPGGVEKQVRPSLPQYSPDITTATQDQNIKPISISNQRCIDVSSDGYHILLTHENGTVYEYTLSTPRDLTSTITSQTANLKNYTWTDCVVYSEDGAYIYVCNTDNSSYSYIEQRLLSTPFDISTAGNVVYSKQTNYRIGGFRFYDNGSKIIGTLRESYIAYGELSTAWDISTLGNLTLQTTQAQYGNYGEGFAISPTGMDCYMVSEYESNIMQLTTTTAYDFSSANQTTLSASLSGNKFGIKVTDDGKYCFIATQNGTIYRYSFQEL